jgi:spore coat polysaccharide biosynthesis protein SpsF
MQKIAAIIQARMGSTRLPGKVLIKICGKTVLEHVVDRVGQSKMINDIIIATTTNIKDDVIEAEADRLGVKVFRGSEEDVLSRYYEAAVKFEADIIIRITSDCPLIDPRIVDKMIGRYLEKKGEIDYLSNTVDRTFPRGLDAEIFAFEILKRANYEAKDLAEREHVTPYIWRNPGLFRNEHYINQTDHSNYRWTLDTKEDLKLIKSIYEQLFPVKDRDFYMEDILDLMEELPSLKSINSEVSQKELDQ